MRRLARAGAIAAVLVAAAAGGARANPLDIARFGGLRGDPTFVGAFSIYWNPAALAAPGWDAALDAQGVARQASYYRDGGLNHVSDEARAANAGVARTATVSVVPGIAGRLGLSLRGVDLGFALGAFVETGGAASWDKNLRAPPQYPGAVDGPQRWSSIITSLTVVDLGAGVALRHRQSGLSFGATPILAVGSFATTRARNIDGTDDLVDSSGNLKEGRVNFASRGYGLGCIFGARWDAGPRVAVAATYQIGAQQHLEGDLRVAFGTQAPSVERATLDLPIADTLRIGASFAIGRWLTLRPMLQWSRWSVLDQHVFRAADGGAPLQTFPRHFGDGYLGRLRADARVYDRVTVTAGFGLEKSPTPTRTLEVGFGEPSSLEAGAGARVQLSHFVDLSASLIFHYLFTTTVSDSIQQPLANGTYRDQREYLLLDLEIHGWHAHR